MSNKNMAGMSDALVKFGRCINYRGDLDQALDDLTQNDREHVYKAADHLVGLDQETTNV